MDFALSTSWNAARLNSSQEIIRQIKNLGFKTIEASFNLSDKMVEELALIVKHKEIQVVSIHNFCPAPKGIDRQIGLPDYYSISSLDEAERKRAVQQTKTSIDTAKRLKAKVLVMHCGRVEVPNRTKDLMALYAKGQKASSEFKRLRASIIRERNKFISAHFGQTLKSLAQISDYAKKQNVKLGIENRVYYREIPSLTELKIILKEFGNSGVFYWHDTGHAQLFENLGLIKHKAYLDSFAPQMIGIHLHDIQGVSDHKAPLEGELDFRIFKPYLKKDTLKVIEAHYPASKEAILKAKAYLEKLYN